MNKSEINEYLKYGSYPENYLSIEEMKILLKRIKSHRKRQIGKESFIGIWLRIIAQCTLEQAIGRIKENKKRKSKNELARKQNKNSSKIYRKE